MLMASKISVHILIQLSNILKNNEFIRNFLFIFFYFYKTIKI